MIATFVIEIFQCPVSSFVPYPSGWRGEYPRTANPPSGSSSTKVTNLTLANVPALSKLPKEVADTLPTSPRLADKILVRDDKWWSQNLKKTEQQFKLWQAS
ncbi:hypothetical protein [Pseudarthrobacter sp. S9]|uniref:hypothetical protein n=1 Tax=Pseudarthrobacter sp. S9 TaxID=3418421 RepID=UPI003D0624CB